MEQTAPGFLIAMPNLKDPNFDGSVVLMLEHNKDGAVGLVVNRPFDGDMEEVITRLGIDWNRRTPGQVRMGGPVHTRSGWIVHRPFRTFADTQIITDEIAISTSRDALEELVVEADTPFRLMLGYAGWGPGQLEREMTEGTWILAPADSQLIFDATTDEIYDRALAALGILRHHLVMPSTAIN